MDIIIIIHPIKTTESVTEQFCNSAHYNYANNFLQGQSPTNTSFFLVMKLLSRCRTNSLYQAHSISTSVLSANHSISNCACNHSTFVSLFPLGFLLCFIYCWGGFKTRIYLKLFPHCSCVFSFPFQHERK